MPEDFDLDQGAAFLLGKISGQLKELIHAQNNSGQILKGLDERVQKLEALENSRAAERNLMLSFLRSPFIAWLIAVAAAAWAGISAAFKHP